MAIPMQKCTVLNFISSVINKTLDSLRRGWSKYRFPKLINRELKTRDNPAIKMRASQIFVLKACIIIKISVKKSGERGIHTRNMRLIIRSIPVRGILRRRLLIFSKIQVFSWISTFPTDINDAALRKPCPIIWRIPSLIPTGQSQRANTMIPIFSLLEYARARLKCFCLISISPAATIVSSPMKINRKLVKSELFNRISTIFLILNR